MTQTSGNDRLQAADPGHVPVVLFHMHGIELFQKKESVNKDAMLIQQKMFSE